MRTYLDQWCALSAEDTVVIVTDCAGMDLAREIKKDTDTYAKACRIINAEEDAEYFAKLQKLADHDLVLVLLTIDSFMNRGFNKVFSPFRKPKGVLAKCAFIRLDIKEDSLQQGLATPVQRVTDRATTLEANPSGSRLHLTNPAGTDIILDVNGFKTFTYQITEPGGLAFLPPSESAAGILPGSANGKIVIDVTVGQLIQSGECIGAFGLVDEPVTLFVKNSLIEEITGGGMARELKEKLFGLPDSCRVLVELGFGLSVMQPTGLIGVDESILDTCHFGVGDGTGQGIDNRAPIHLDLVLSSPELTRIEA